MIRRLLLLLAVIATPSPALAWWEYGHAVVAAVALRTMTPRTRAAVDALLNRQDLLRTPGCPARRLEDAAYWADCIKPLGDRFSYIYSWHYQNVDVCKPFDAAVSCADGNCVMRQVERTTRLLADRSLPLRDRVEALALLAHLAGDLAQPMHAGDRGDRGGNDLRVRYGVIGGRTNLHAIWDGLLADRALSTPPAAPDGLLAGVTPAVRAAIQAGSVEEWAREGWERSRALAYAPALGGEACGPPPAGGGALDQAAIAALIPGLRDQALRGGLRLARLLDEALGGVAPAPGSPLLPRPRA